MIRFSEWSRATLASVSALSQTSKGQLRSDYDGAKPKLLIEDPSELALLVEKNLQTAIAYLWMHARPDEEGHHETVPQVREFMDAVASKVSKGLLAQGASLLRTWDTRVKYPWQVAPEDIEHEYDKLVYEVAHRMLLSNDEEQGIRDAARLVRELNWRVHPYADGCGRTSALLGAWILLRHDLMPPLFDDIEAYYDAMRRGEGEWAEYYRSYLTVHS